MKQVLLIALGLLMCDSVWAEVQGGKLSFEERQASTPMTVTSVNLSKGGGTITAEGDMGEYGRAYLTYTLTADANGMGGTVVGEGRGAMQGGAFASGSGTGAYYRDGTAFTMHVIFRINDGTQNFDKIVFDAYTRELTHDAYILK
jgi:hypothetical protein